MTITNTFGYILMPLFMLTICPLPALPFSFRQSPAAPSPIVFTSEVVKYFIFEHFSSLQDLIFSYGCQVLEEAK